MSQRGQRIYREQVFRRYQGLNWPGRTTERGTTDCKLTEDKRTYLGQNLSLPRTRSGVGTAGELYED